MTKIRLVSYCNLKYWLMCVDFTFWGKGKNTIHFVLFLLFV